MNNTLPALTPTSMTPDTPEMAHELGLPCFCHACISTAKLSAEANAREFHKTYEMLAPEFGYVTRPETREFDPASPNGQLMIAVCGHLNAEAETRLSALRERIAVLEGALEDRSRDAERYRWMREHADVFLNEPAHFKTSTGSYIWTSQPGGEEETDAAIDSGMNAEQQRQQMLQDEINQHNQG